MRLNLMAVSCSVIFLSACGAGNKNSCSWVIENTANKSELASGSHLDEGDDAMCRSKASVEINSYCARRTTQYIIATSFEWKGTASLFGKESLVAGTIHSAKTCGPN